MSKLTKIEATYIEEIRNAAERFGDHEDMSPGHVLGWLGQFALKDVPIGCAVLEKTKYYNTTNIRAKTRELIRMIADELSNDRIILVPVGEHGGGASTVARAMRDSKDAKRLRVASMIELVSSQDEEQSVVVFIDDFSGTGDTLCDWWANVEPLIRPKNLRVVVALLVMTSKARERVLEFAEQAICVDEVGPEFNVFSHQSTDFSDLDKERILRYCRKTKCSEEYTRGYGECGLLLAFKHGCPNDSIPILWYDAKGWRRLFRRRGL